MPRAGTLTRSVNTALLDFELSVGFLSVLAAFALAAFGLIAFFCFTKEFWVEFVVVLGCLGATVTDVEVELDVGRLRHLVQLSRVIQSLLG